METVSSQTFVVLFSVNFDYKNDTSRVVLLRRFLEEGPGAGITVVDQTILLNSKMYSFIMVAEAAQKEVLEAALEPCAEILRVRIIPVSSAQFNPKVAARYCLLCRRGSQTAKPAANFPDALRDGVQVRGQYMLPEDSQLAAVWLVDAPQGGIAKRFVHSAMPSAGIHTLKVEETKHFFNRVFGPEKDMHKAAVEPSFELPVMAGSGPDTSAMVLYNEDPNSAIYADGGSLNGTVTDYYSIFGKRTDSWSYTPTPVNSVAHLWNTSSSTFTYICHWEEYYDDAPHDTYNDPYTHNSPFPLPAIALPHIPGNTYGFDLSKSNIAHIRSPFSLWLNDLVNTTTHDAPWPEDTYEGDHLLAYKYWLSLLDSPPKEGLISAGVILQLYDVPGYPANANFSKQAYDDVFTQLSNECNYFDIIYKWFGENGVFATINGQVATASAIALDAAANYMQIPKETSRLSLLLDEAVTAISGVISCIPFIGGALSAVLNVAWENAKMGMTPDQQQQSLQGNIADMALKLTDTMQVMVTTVATQNNALNSNWGKLSEFAKQAMTGDLFKEQDFGVTTQSGGTRKDKNNSTTLPEGYITGATNAWLVVILKSLFASAHTVQTSVDFSDTPPANPWNPDSGVYEYVWYLPGYYYGGTNDQNHKGFIELHSTTDAPPELMQILFGTNSRLNVDPMEFFIGFNGWPQITPVYQGRGDYNSPIVSIGN